MKKFNEMCIRGRLGSGVRTLPSGYGNANGDSDSESDEEISRSEAVAVAAAVRVPSNLMNGVCQDISVFVIAVIIMLCIYL